MPLNFQTRTQLFVAVSGSSAMGWTDETVAVRADALQAHLDTFQEHLTSLEISIVSVTVAAQPHDTGVVLTAVVTYRDITSSPKVKSWPVTVPV